MSTEELHRVISRYKEGKYRVSYLIRRLRVYSDHHADNLSPRSKDAMESLINSLKIRKMLLGNDVPRDQVVREIAKSLRIVEKEK